jgi:hypothetical protein
VLYATRIVAVLALGTAIAACSGDGHDGWTTEQGESIRLVRGLPVDVRTCRGLGEPDGRRYDRLQCVAGARLPGEQVDTVAIRFVIVPHGEDYELRNVRFFGGPGIP